MKPKAMRALAHSGNHVCAPKAWRDVPIVSGDYDTDATIAHRSNANLPARLELYTSRDAYGPLTGYDAYSGYHGDN